MMKDFIKKFLKIYSPDCCFISRITAWIRSCHSSEAAISGVIASIVGGTVVALLGGSQLTITGPGNGLVIVLL